MNKACFLSEFFYDQPVVCPVTYYSERTAQTDKNGI